MNLILLFKDDFVSSSHAVISGRRRDHILTVLKPRVGDRLAVGLLRGAMGAGTVKELGERVLLEVDLGEPPPAALPLTLIMALPRPNVLKRTLLCASSLGIKKIYILNFCCVEKSLWSSSALRPEIVQEQLILGLEQAKDTVLPEVVLKDRFRPFVEDELPDLTRGALGLVAHPGPETPRPRPLAEGKPVTLVIGPEGGIIDYELQSLIAAGCQQLSLGPRILKIESALPHILGILR